MLRVQRSGHSALSRGGNACWADFSELPLSPDSISPVNSAAYFAVPPAGSLAEDRRAPPAGTPSASFSAWKPEQGSQLRQAARHPADHSAQHTPRHLTLPQHSAGQDRAHPHCSSNSGVMAPGYLQEHNSSSSRSCCSDSIPSAEYDTGSDGSESTPFTGVSARGMRDHGPMAPHTGSAALGRIIWPSHHPKSMHHQQQQQQMLAHSAGLTAAYSGGSSGSSRGNSHSGCISYHRAPASAGYILVLPQQASRHTPLAAHAEALHNYTPECYQTEVQINDGSTTSEVGGAPTFAGILKCSSMCSVDHPRCSAGCPRRSIKLRAVLKSSSSSGSSSSSSSNIASSGSCRTSSSSSQGSCSGGHCQGSFEFAKPGGAVPVAYSREERQCRRQQQQQLEAHEQQQQQQQFEQQHQLHLQQIWLQKQQHMQQHLQQLEQQQLQPQLQTQRRHHQQQQMTLKVLEQELQHLAEIGNKLEAATRAAAVSSAAAIAIGAAVAKHAEAMQQALAAKAALQRAATTQSPMNSPHCHPSLSVESSPASSPPEVPLSPARRASSPVNPISSLKLAGSTSPLTPQKQQSRLSPYRQQQQQQLHEANYHQQLLQHQHMQLMQQQQQQAYHGVGSCRQCLPHVSCGQVCHMCELQPAAAAAPFK